jgi:hypothetical protein
MTDPSPNPTPTPVTPPPSFAPVMATCPKAHTDCSLRVKVGVSAIQLALWCQLCRKWYSVTAKAQVITYNECRKCPTGFSG